MAFIQVQDVNDFLETVIPIGDWEDDQFQLRDLADNFQFYADYFRTICNDAPNFAVSMKNAVAHAAAIASAEAFKAQILSEAMKPIYAAWEAAKLEDAA